MKRSCGVILPISALPSAYGIGTLGKAAYEFVDFLAAAGQSWWQVLPIGPTSLGDSPYQSPSAYAGNPYFVDLDLLCADGLLTAKELQAIDWGDDPARVDYGKIYAHRFALLEKAAAVGWQRDAKKVEEFVEKNRHWLPDYALFMAVKRHFSMLPWTAWPDEDIRLHKPEGLKTYRALLAKDVRLFTYIQYLFFAQWDALWAYAHKQGVGIIGDMPIYVSMDSADVWAEPGCFQLDRKNVPTAVAGVPPDYFSEDGQLWGNPLYNWEAMKKDGYGWWIRRIDGAAKCYDVLRIDHFRGLESYWAVPFGEKTAKNGKWVKGPGMDLLGVLCSWFPQLQFIAEDLGFLTPKVKQLLADSGLPGMKVLEFAFDPQGGSDYLPHTYPRNCVCYGGTHDNAPLAAWVREAEPAELAFAREYLGLGPNASLCQGILRAGLASVADLFVTQMQDYLRLGKASRMNTPGLTGENWQWRLLPGQATEKLAKDMARLARIYGRA